MVLAKSVLCRQSGLAACEWFFRWGTFRTAFHLEFEIRSTQRLCGEANSFVGVVEKLLALAVALGVDVLFSRLAKGDWGVFRRPPAWVVGFCPLEKGLRADRVLCRLLCAPNSGAPHEPEVWLSASRNIVHPVRLRCREINVQSTLGCEVELSARSILFVVHEHRLDYLFRTARNERGYGTRVARSFFANSRNYRMFQFVRQSVPAEAKILLQGIVRGFYCDRAYMWDHPFQRLLNYGEFKEPVELLMRMRELGISHVARMMKVPAGRTLLGYPQYFSDNFHESFRKSYLKPIYRDESYVLFEVVYPNGT